MVLDSGERLRARAVVANCDPRRTFLELIELGATAGRLPANLEAAEPAASGFAVHLGVAGAPEGKPLTFVSDLAGGGCLVAQPGLVDPDDAPHGYAAIDIFSLMSAEQAAKWFPPDEACRGRMGRVIGDPRPISRVKRRWATSLSRARTSHPRPAR